MKIQKENTDRGYAWIVLIACTIMQFLTDGISKSFGLFYVEILDQYHDSVSSVTLITGIMNGVFCLSTLPIMMYLIKVISPRKCVLIGGLLTAFGYSLSCMAESIYLMFFTLSFLVGGGMAFIYPTSIYILTTYFEKRRALSNGIAISGCCLGGLLCPPVYRYLLDTYGLHGALLLTGGILLHNLPMACLLRPNKNDRQKNVKKDEIEHMLPNDLVILKNVDESCLNTEQYNSSKPTETHELEQQRKHILYKLENTSDFNVKEYQTKPEVLVSHVQNEGKDGFSEQFFENESQRSCPTACTPLLNTRFIIFLFANTLASIVPIVFLSFLPLSAKDYGIDNTKIVILVSLTGAVDFVSRIVVGFLADNPKINKYQILALSQALCGIIFNCNQLLTSFPGFIVLCVVIGLCGGVQLVLMFTHITEIVGIDLSPPAVAITILCQLPAFICGPFIFGLLRDITGHFHASYHVTGSIAIVASIFYMCEPLTKRCQPESQTRKNIGNQIT